MDYDNPYAPSSSYQVDNSIMRPANLPALSLQTIGSDRNAPPSGFRGGPPPFGGGGPDRNAPRRGGYRGGQGQRGRPPRGPGGGGPSHSYQDRNVNNFPGMNNGYHNNAPLANGGGGGGYDGNGYEPDRRLGAQPYMQGGYAAGGPGNAFPRDSTQQGFAPPRNEYDAGYDQANPPRFNDRGPAPFPGKRDKPVDERVQHERPCRTLFVRNVNYGADSQRIRADFERYGEIKTFFDIISTRGMAFITYFDLRGAERAREEMHNSLVNGRPIDVHYSLPKAEEVSGECTREKNQGSLELRLRNGRPISEVEVQRAFSSFGPIKDIRNAPSPDKKIVEFFDARNAIAAHDAMDSRPFQETEMQVRFIWDFPDIARSSVPAGAGRGRGGRARGRGGDRGDERDRSPDHGYSRSAPYSSDRSRRKSSDAGTIASTTVTNKDPSARLDEAKKIQDLLASLSQGVLAKPSAPPATQTPFPAATSIAPSAPATRPVQDDRGSGYSAYTPTQQYPYPSAYAMPNSNAYVPPVAPSVASQKPATPAYVPPSAPVVPPTTAVNTAYVPPAAPSIAPQAPAVNHPYPAAGQSRAEPAASGYGRHPLLPQTSGYPVSYPSNGTPMPPASMNTAPSAPSYGYTPAAPAPAPALAPAPTMPQVAPGMSDLLALLAAQQKK